MEPISEVYNMDCMEYMRSIPDKFFELAIVDPPYEIARFKKASGTTRFHCSKRMQEEGLKWDKVPDEIYFKELFRVSTYQIIWGANNFSLPKSEHFLIWDKQQSVPNFSSAEYAWVSPNFKKPAKVFRYSVMKNNNTDKIHPTQKPIALYAWLLKNYAKAGDKILDTHLGSGSHRIAAYKMGFDFYACELDKEYFDAQEERFRRECFGEIKTMQGQTIIQQSFAFD